MSANKSKKAVKGKADRKDEKKKASSESSNDLQTKAAEAAEENATNRPIDAHPLAIGHALMVKYRDGSERLAKIIEKYEKVSEMGTKEYTYYVHYYDFNRRMDERIHIDRITLYPSEANILKTEYEAQNGHAHISDEVKKLVDDPSVLSNLKPAISRKRDRGDDSSSSGAEDPSKPTTVSELEHDEHEGLDEAALLEHEEITKIKNIENVLFGKHKMECWYFSPFPKEYYPDGPVECLYFCEFTFRYFRTKQELIRHQSKPNLPRHPPGNEIYRDDKVSMFEMDGGVEKFYCQNLCYFAKLFLDHKTLYWDVDPFLFYVLCTHDDRGYHPVGFFSKEKFSDLGFNLACILTFPSAQRQGYGRFLIAFSYELSKKEEKAGSPEKPLSDLGALSYKSYWASTILGVLRNFQGHQISILDITKSTSIAVEDVSATLQMLGLLQCVNSIYSIYAPAALIDELLGKYPNSGLHVDPEKLQWVPLYITDFKKDKWSFKAKREGQIEGSVAV